MQSKRILLLLKIFVLVTLALGTLFWPQSSPASAAFPGANGKIVFNSSRVSPGVQQIYTMNLDGSRVTNITNNPETDRYPVWSPDGAKIVFVSEPDGLNSGDVYVMNADGSGQTNLTNHPALHFTGGWQPLPPTVGGFSVDLVPVAATAASEAPVSSLGMSAAIFAVIGAGGFAILGGAAWYAWRRRV